MIQLDSWLIFKVNINSSLRSSTLVKLNSQNFIGSLNSISARTYKYLAIAEAYSQVFLKYFCKSLIITKLIGGDKSRGSPKGLAGASGQEAEGDIFRNHSELILSIKGKKLIALQMYFVLASNSKTIV